MVTRVLSLLRASDPGAARGSDPALDLNAYAVAEDVELTLLLRGPGLELALAEAHTRPLGVAGIDVPVASPQTDLRALLASGVRVLAVSEDLDARGLASGDLVDGIEVVAESDLARLLLDHDVTLASS